MLILALDSAALTASVALLREDRVLSDFSCTNSLNHSVNLMPMIDQVLKLGGVTLGEVDAFAVSAGPGSFTGVRIGISTVKGLMAGTGKLCAPVSTLEALAANEAGSAGVICAMMDARRGEFYCACFETDTASGKLVRLTEDAAETGEVIRARLEKLGRPAVLCGDGAEIFLENFQPCASRLALAPKRLQRAASVAVLGREILSSGGGVTAEKLCPAYLRASGAERKREKKDD